MISINLSRYIRRLFNVKDIPMCHINNKNMFSALPDQLPSLLGYKVYVILAMYNVSCVK